MPTNKKSASRYTLALFIVHPSISAAEISDLLGLVPQYVHDVGLPKVTPAGTMLGGLYPDTRWRHVAEYFARDNHFISGLENFIGRLADKESALAALRRSGGSTCLIVSFLGDGYFGDEIPISVLSKLTVLGLDLGIEVYTVPQSRSRGAEVRAIGG